MVRKYKNSGFAGEMLVAAELSRLGYQVMLGNVGSYKTRSCDMTAYCPIKHRAVGISVKSVKTRTNFTLSSKSIHRKPVYVFVVTGPAKHQPEFHVIRGAKLLANKRRFFRKWGRPKKKKAQRQGIPFKFLRPYRDNWTALGP